MAGKHRKVKVERAPTKHQLSRWEKEKRASRIIYICLAVIVIGLAIGIGLGVYFEQVVPYQKTVITVNDVSFDYDYYLKMFDTMTAGQTDSSILKAYTDVVANIVIQSELVKENAAEAGITCTDEEINKELEAANLDRNDANIALVRTRIITQKYTDQVCLPKQPQSVKQAEVEAMLLESTFMAEDRRQKLVLGDNFSTMAGMVSIDSVTLAKKGYLGWIPKGYESYALGELRDSALGEVIFTLTPEEISEPVFDADIEKAYGYWVLEVIEKDDTKGIHALGILCGSKEDADTARAKLKEGASWDAVARQYSQHDSKDNGGDLGWRAPGVDKDMLSRILSGMEANQLSDAIRDDSVSTTGGYWLVEVLNVEDRPLDSSISQILSEDCLTEWVESLIKDARTENMLDDQQKDLAVEKVIKNRSQ